MNLSQRMRMARLELGLTQIKLSSTSGISLPTIQNIEAGKANPSLSVLEALFPTLGLSLDVNPIPANWDLLSEICAPILLQKKSKGSLDAIALVRELKRAVGESRRSGEDENRKVEVTSALLWAIKGQFPTFFKEHFSRMSGALAHLAKPPSGKVLKLKRFAEGHLSLYL